MGREVLFLDLKLVLVKKDSNFVVLGEDSMIWFFLDDCGSDLSWGKEVNVKVLSWVAHSEIS